MDHPTNSNSSGKLESNSSKFVAADLQKKIEELELEFDTEQRENNALKYKQSSHEAELIIQQDLSEMKSQNQALNHQINDMKQFLSDYGIEWIGPSSESSSEPVAKQGRINFQADFRLLKQRVDEINVLLEPRLSDGKCDDNIEEVEDSKTRSRRSYLNLSVQVSLFRNGLTLSPVTVSSDLNDPLEIGSCKFLSYLPPNRSGCRFVADLMDGYVPEVMKSIWGDDDDDNEPTSSRANRSRTSKNRNYNRRPRRKLILVDLTRADYINNDVVEKEEEEEVKSIKGTATRGMTMLEMRDKQQEDKPSLQQIIDKIPNTVIVNGKIIRQVKSSIMNQDSSHAINRQSRAQLAERAALARLSK